MALLSLLCLALAAPVFGQHRSLLSRQNQQGNSASCPASGPYSCQNTTAQANTCCFNSPGGALLQTQFWDTNPASGPSNSWTIHGLWPDNCDGTYEANCDDSRAYTNITQILQSFGQTDLLNYMNTYWTSNTGTAESFWEHEWGKHGTCRSPLGLCCHNSVLTFHRHLNIEHAVLHQLQANRGGPRFLQQGRWPVQELANLHMAFECWHHPFHISDLYSFPDPECAI